MFAYSTFLRVCVLSVLGCLCAYKLSVLACLRAYVLGMLACYHAWHACKLLCLACLRARAFDVFACSRASCAFVFAYFTFLRVCVLSVLVLPCLALAYSRFCLIIYFGSINQGFAIKRKLLIHVNLS